MSENVEMPWQPLKNAHAGRPNTGAVRLSTPPYLRRFCSGRIKAGLLAQVPGNAAPSRRQKRQWFVQHAPLTVAGPRRLRTELPYYAWSGTITPRTQAPCSETIYSCLVSIYTLYVVRSSSFFVPQSIYPCYPIQLVLYNEWVMLHLPLFKLPHVCRWA